MIRPDSETLELLRQVPAFRGLNDAELNDILKISTRKRFSKNQPIFTIDQEARQLYVVESGTCILNLRDRKFKTFKSGDLFGEVAIINENVRTGTIRALEESVLIAVEGASLFDPQCLDPRTTLKIIRELARMVTYYLRSQEQVSTAELIEKGENEQVEFKSSMRWNLKSDSNDHLIEQAIIRTIAAFMNTKGGTLLVGVRDDGKVIGIGQDRFENSDKMLLHLTRLIKQRIGSLHMRFISFEIEEIGQHQVLRVDVDPATVPAYIIENNNHESFCIRTGPSTTQIRVSKIYEYIQMRF
ncbi:MAG: RNA-binding domain-containing protein [Gammaproteobacteria bacterium]